MIYKYLRFFWQPVRSRPDFSLSSFILALTLLGCLGVKYKKRALIIVVSFHIPS